MSKAEAAKKLYEECKDMDIDETMELVLNAETEEEQDFFSMLSDFILQRKQKKLYTGLHTIRIRCHGSILMKY